MTTKRSRERRPGRGLIGEGEAVEKRVRDTGSADLGDAVTGQFGVALPVWTVMTIPDGSQRAKTGRAPCRPIGSRDESSRRPVEGDPGASGSVLSNELHLRCDYLAQEFSLTERETEVLELLVRGRTRILIQKELILSET